jgi:hypothetical protein
MASKNNIRVTRQEASSLYFYKYDDIDATAGAPIGLGEKIGGVTLMIKYLILV